MATLASIFGSEIRVTVQPAQAVRKYHGFSGANGVTALHLGTRGRQVIVQGILRAATAALLQDAVDTIEGYTADAATTYTHQGATYANIVWERPVLHPDRDGKSFRWGPSGWFTFFTMYGRTLT